MLQLALILLGGIVVVMGLMSLLRGEITLSKSSKLEGGPAKAVGAAVLLFGLAVVGFAWFILPHTGRFRW